MRGAVATVKEAARAEAVSVDVEARMVQEVAAVAMAAVMAYRAGISQSSNTDFQKLPTAVLHVGIKDG